MILQVKIMPRENTYVSTQTIKPTHTNFFHFYQPTFYLKHCLHVSCSIESEVTDVGGLDGNGLLHKLKEVASHVGENMNGNVR